MISLFQLSHWSLMALLLGLLLMLILQMFCLVYSFFGFRYRRRHLWRSLLEVLLLCQGFLWLSLAAGALCQLQNGFLVLHACVPLRRLLCGALGVVSLIVCVQNRELSVLSVPLTAALTLPLPELRLGSGFPLLLGSVVLFWTLLAVDRLAACHVSRRSSLSAFSVKEAVDTLDFGILFCRTTGSDGQILLTNRKMQELMVALTGGMPCSGKAFYAALVSGSVLPSCTRETPPEALCYTLPDGRTWQFLLRYETIDQIRCAMLIASDITEHKAITDQLARQDRALQQRAEDLKGMLQDLEQICRSEELLRAKNRVHDLLGQQISLFLRAVREHQEPDEALLRAFANGLPEELRNTSADGTRSLKAIARSYRNIGVDVQVEGQLPPQPRLQRLCVEIASEAMTNAVRHGCATEIRITSRETGSHWELRIRDNGSSGTDKITEGGGLTGIRRKVTELGGCFSYQVSPYFELLVRLPGGTTV